MVEKGSPSSKTRSKAISHQANFLTYSNELIQQSLEVHKTMSKELKRIHEKLFQEVRQIDLQRKEDCSDQAEMQNYEIQKQRAEFYMNLVGYQLAFCNSYSDKIQETISRYEANYDMKRSLLGEWVDALDKLQNYTVGFGVDAIQRINENLDKKLDDKASIVQLECKRLLENVKNIEIQKEESAILNSDKNKLELSLASKEQEVKQLTKSLNDLEHTLKKLQADCYLEKTDNEIPQDGWHINSQHQEKTDSIQNSKVALVTILGGIRSGKSWLASQLNSGRGWRNPPDSISIHYACRSEGKWFGTLLSSGWNEPIKPRDGLNFPKDFQKKDNSQLLEIYKELTDESKLIENLKLSYLIRSSHLILLVIEQFTQSELEKIQLIKNLMSNSQNNPRLIIVHNFRQIKTRNYVNHTVDNCLRKIFQFEEQPLFNDSNILGDEGNVHKSLFKDEFGIIHLIIAAEDHEAGKFYNKGPLKFLLSKIDMLENKVTFSFCENFVDFCNSQLTNISGIDFGLKCLDDKVIATNKQAKLTSSSMNATANVFSQSDFEPKYSTKLEWFSEGDEARVAVDIEVLDSVIEKKSLRVFEGYHYLTVVGTRKEIFSEDEKQKLNEGKMLLTKGTRREGNYILDIRLIGSSMERKQDVEVLEEDTGLGIKRITIEFAKPKEHVI